MAQVAFHFLPVLGLRRDCQTVGSTDSCIIIAILALPALYSSATDLKGNKNFAVLQYSTTSVKLDGTPSHFLLEVLSFLLIHRAGGDIVNEPEAIAAWKSA